MSGWLQRTKERWGIESTTRIILIMLVFSLAGMAITQIRPPVWHLFHFTDATPTWIKVVTYILLIFPTYQICLLIFGALLGQFRFFWEKEKKMGRWFLRRLGLR